MTVLSLLVACTGPEPGDPHRGHPAYGDHALDSDADTDAAETDLPAGDEAFVSFVHLIDDVPALDVRIEPGGPVAGGLGWGEASDASAGPSAVPAGESRLVVTRASLPDAGALIDAPLTLDAGARVTVLLVGSERLGLVDVSLAPRAKIVPGLDDGAPGTTAVLLVHAAPAWPAFDIYAGPFPIASLTFGGDSGALGAPSGTGTLGFDADGDGAVEQEVIAELPDAGALYGYVVARPGAPPPAVRLLVHTPGAAPIAVDP